MDDPPTHFRVENSLAKELNKLSTEDRLAIQEEIHGVRCGATDETSDLLKESLQDFDDKINALKEQAEANPKDDGQNVRILLRNIIRTNRLPTAAANTSTDILPEGVKSCDTSERPELNCCFPKNCYLNDDNVRLRFLRCECFNVDKAVQRLVNFLEYCTEIFGRYICERKMRLSDFNTREEELGLRTSRSQYLPFRDRSGRRVLASVGACNFHIPLKTRLKIRIFQHWVASEDVETQRKGIVIVMWPFDEDERSESSWEKTIRPYLCKRTGEYQKLNNRAMPVRVASQQMYYKDTPIFHMISALYVFYALTSDRRAIYNAHFGTCFNCQHIWDERRNLLVFFSSDLVSLKSHESNAKILACSIFNHLLPRPTHKPSYFSRSTITTTICSQGEHTELLYKLGSFGIPIDLLPVSYTGGVKFVNQIAWLNFLRAREKNLEEGGNDNEEMIDCPRSYDVVFRKGTTFRHNLGNTYYRGLIEENSVEHLRGKKKKKYEITLRIVTEIEKREGRFLEWSNKNKLWMLMKDRDTVRKKIAAAMKQYLRTKKGGEPSSPLQLKDEQEELESAIDNANDILGTNSTKRETKNAVKPDFSNGTSLKQYYSLEHIGKRQKIAISQNGNEGSCFGKVFHPML